MTRAILAVVASVSLFGCATGPAPAQNGMERWSENHPAASQELGAWVQTHPDAAARFFEWDGHHPERGQPRHDAGDKIDAIVNSRQEKSGQARGEIVPRRCPRRREPPAAETKRGFPRRQGGSTPP